MRRYQYSSLQKNLAMNSQIQAETQQLKVYLDQYPYEAAQLAVNHLEDYLILLNEYQRLKEQIELFGQSKTSKVSLDNFINAQLTLAQQFRVEVVKRYLVQNPHKSQFWAVEYFKFLLHLNETYLEKRAELISLNNKPSLPYFL
jgi:hypothetical protein